MRLPNDPGSGAVEAIDPSTGEVRWKYPLYSMPLTGILSTAGHLVFGGTLEGQFFALDAATGKELWHALSAPEPGCRVSRSYSPGRT